MKTITEKYKPGSIIDVDGDPYGNLLNKNILYDKELIASMKFQVSKFQLAADQQLAAAQISYQTMSDAILSTPIDIPSKGINKYFFQYATLGGIVNTDAPTDALPTHYSASGTTIPEWETPNHEEVIEPLKSTAEALERVGSYEREI